MVEMCLRSRERDKALAAVHKAFDDLEMLDSKLSPKDPLSLILRPRIVTILAGNGITTVGELCQHSRDTLATIHQIRYLSIDLIEGSLEEHGFKLRRS